MALKGRQRGLYGANKGVNAATFQIKRIRTLDFSSKAFVLFWSLGCTIPASLVFLLCLAGTFRGERVSCGLFWYILLFS